MNVVKMALVRKVYAVQCFRFGCLLDLTGKRRSIKAPGGWLDPAPRCRFQQSMHQATPISRYLWPCRQRWGNSTHEAFLTSANFLKLECCNKDSQLPDGVLLGEGSVFDINFRSVGVNMHRSWIDLQLTLCPGLFGRFRTFIGSDRILHLKGGRDSGKTTAHVHGAQGECGRVDGRRLRVSPRSHVPGR